MIAPAKTSEREMESADRLDLIGFRLPLRLGAGAGAGAWSASLAQAAER